MWSGVRVSDGTPKGRFYNRPNFLYAGDDNKMINTKRLRSMLGWLGMLLPWIVLVFSYCYGYGIPDSISSTYYISTCITPFMIILGAAGLLLISYKGYDKCDDIICTIAGIFGLMICIFPCSTSGLAKEWDWFTLGNTDPVGMFNLAANISGKIHNLSAVIFFGLLAFNSLFLFTKSSGKKTKNKIKRNIIFRVCGLGMIMSLVLIIPIGKYGIWGGTWLIEMLALTFFGISWLTKSNIYSWLFADSD